MEEQLQKKIKKVLLHNFLIERELNKLIDQLNDNPNVQNEIKRIKEIQLANDSELSKAIGFELSKKEKEKFIEYFEIMNA